jgi:hypothetical protein
MEVAASEVNDLRKRLKHLEGVQDLPAKDTVHPEVLIQAIVEQWLACGLSLESWTLVNEKVQHHINTQWRQIYAKCNAELVSQGVLPVIELESKAKPRPAPVPASYVQATIHSKITRPDLMDRVPRRAGRLSPQQPAGLP